jgi:hypothetical protein
MMCSINENTTFHWFIEALLPLLNSLNLGSFRTICRCQQFEKMVRTNHVMERYLQRLGYDFWTKRVDLPTELEEIIYQDFLTNNDCIILKALYDHDSNPGLKSDLEKCEWESNETHFHIDDYVQNPDDEIEYLSIGLECAKRLQKRFDQEFADKKFRILISFNETVKDENGYVDFYGSCTVRFHQVRLNCDDVMRADDMEKFKVEAVMEIEK